MDWRSHAERLADEVTHARSRWREAVGSTARHELVPRWFEPEPEDVWEWSMRVVDGPSDPDRWMRTTYSDRTLLTKLGVIHADDTGAERVSGRQPTSSATNPATVVGMLRHACVHDGADVLDVATGCGYSAALLCRRLGEKYITSVDVDPDLTGAAVERLDRVGLHPKIITADARGTLPDTYDRIVAMTSVRPIPASWLAALRPGGRLVTAIAGTTLLLTADKKDDGRVIGRIAYEPSGFMPARASAEYPPHQAFETFRNLDGEHLGRGRLPLWPLKANAEVASLLALAEPDVTNRYERSPDGHLTVWLTHPDGSWARASTADCELPEVHQAGPRRLWDLYERIRDDWNWYGTNPALGARATIDPDGTLHLTNQAWSATIPAHTGE